MLWSNQAREPQPLSLHSGSCVLQLLRSVRAEPMLSNKRSRHSEKARRHNKEQPPLPEKAQAQRQRPTEHKESQYNF